MYYSGGQKPDTDLSGLKPNSRQGRLLLEASGENLFPGIFQLLEVTCILWLVAPSSILKASNGLEVFLTSYHLNTNLAPPSLFKGMRLY